MTLYGLKKRLIEFCLNRLWAGTNPKYFERKRKLLNSLGHRIGKGTKVVGPIHITGKLCVGENCWLGKNFLVNGNGSVTIGNNCDIAPEVTFQTGTHEIGNSQRRAGKGKNQDIIVGNGCWIGVRTTILSGVIIGDGALVAACACVKDSVNKNTLVGGVPAKEIRKLSDD